jgi:hypothetical protein
MASEKIKIESRDGVELRVMGSEKSVLIVRR